MKATLLAGVLTFLAGPLAALGAPAPAADAGEKAFYAYVLGHYDRGLELARPAALSGSFMAQFTLARGYEDGKGVAKDGAQAETWFRKTLAGARPAAESGDPSAQFVLGRMHEAGWILSKDAAQAATWYRKSAEQGYAIGQYALATLYYSGEGVAKNFDEAAAWFRKAADQDYAPGQFALAGLMLRGEGVAKNYDEAFALYRKSADQNYGYGQAGLASMYYQGLGVTKNLEAAFDWERKAAEQGVAMAQGNLAAMYEGGQGVAKNDAQAAVWMQKAADQDYAASQYSVGFAYDNGTLGYPRDDAQALAWYRKAADQDYVPPSRVHKPGDLWDDARATRAERKAALQPAPETAKAAPAGTKAARSDVDEPSGTAAENPNNFAVVVGVENYASLPAAEYAERDAEAVRANLMALGYPARNIYYLSGQRATRAKLAQSVNTWLPNRVDEKSTVFFYYSGHGAPDPKTSQAYLVPVDGDPEDLDSTAYPIKQLYAKLGALKARRVIVALDSCFSGAGGRSVLAKGTRPLVAKIDMGAAPDKLVALTASGQSQTSGTLEDQGHGAFTYYLLKGLGGAAKNETGRVTAKSLYDYLTPKVQNAARLHNRDQTPQLMGARSSSISF